MIEKRFCQNCGALYVGGSSSRFCPACRKQRKKEYIAKWAKEHREARTEATKRYRERQKKNYEAIYNYGALPKIEEENYFLGDEKRYCSGYDSGNLECIKCYENQTKEYKGCRK